MLNAIESVVLAAIIAMSVGGVAVADPFDDAVAAYNREDFATAIPLFRPLADQGNADAQYVLAMMYRVGDGVPENGAEAVRWYRKAADQGLAPAQLGLGLMYANGEGVPQNDVEAYMWWNLAAAQGEDDAKENKAILEKRMTREQIAEAQKLSAEWKPTK